MAEATTELHAIYLDESDDIVSVCDRVTWAAAHQRLVLVLPEGSNLLVEYLDLVRLRRTAEQLRIEVGLVTHDGRIAEQARALGFPFFTSLARAEKSRRAWWRGRRGWHKPTRPGTVIALGSEGGIKSLPDDADRREMYRRMTPRVTWQRWLLRYLGILLFFVTLAAIFVGLAYTVPGATLVLRPEIAPLQVSTQVVADPQLETTNFSGASVPGRLLVVNAEWQTEVETTGMQEVPDAPARGTVVFFNLLDQPVTVPAGTQVSTSSGNRVVYQVISGVEVPGVVGGTAEADVVAIEPGPQGNVAANQVNQVDGSLGLQLEVRNIEPLTGGGSRTAAAVTDADHERLRAQVLQYLQTLAISEMEAALNEGEFLARDSLRVVEIEDETYSHFVGERTDQVTLEIRAELHGTAVDASQANDLVYLSLIEAVEPGFELVPHSLRFRPGEVLGVDSQGRVSFVMSGEGVMAARLDLAEPLNVIAGQKTELALGYLNEQLPLRALPTVRVWPNWLGRMPYLPVRIQTEVDTGF
jgi:hypothetical protein